MKFRNLLWSQSIGVFAIFGLTACQSTPPPTPTPTSATPTSTSRPAISAAKAQRMKERAAALAARMEQNPCSVQIWEDENFEDDNDLIVGPLESRDMKNIPGANKDDWGDEIDSLKVGSKATVTVWQDEDFKDTSATYGPGTEKTNLRGNPNFGDDIDSMKITCAP
jgi:hypothetical protein